MVFFFTPLILFILLLRKISLEFEWIFYRCQIFNLQSKGRYWSFVFLLNPVQPYFWIRVNFLSKEPKSLMNQRKIRDKRGVSSWHWFWLGSFKKMVAFLKTYLIDHYKFYKVLKFQICLCVLSSIPSILTNVITSDWFSSTNLFSSN